MQLPDIFLSYNREDLARAKVFVEAFEAQGFSVWWDVGLKTGEAYDEVTEAALRGAKAVVVLWSPRSVVSRWVRAEATLADRNKTLAPCMIEPCDRPIMFELTQTAELTHWQGDAADRAWVAFLADVRRFVERAAPVTAQPVLNVLSSADSAGTPKGARGERPSLAVMPFTNRSGVAADDALAFGMVEDVISAISLSPDIRVLASSATRQWEGRQTDLRVVGRDLGVRYVLEGNVRRTGANLRVTVQLVEAESGGILWTQRFDRPLSELAELQEDLVTEVAASLGVQVQNLEFERVLRKPGDITAWEAVQRSISVFGKLTLDRLPAALADARHAIAIAPDYGAAHAMATGLLAMQYMWTGESDEVLRTEALHHDALARAFSPQDAMVMATSAVALNRLGRMDDALRNARRAVELNPSVSFCHGVLATVLMWFGRNEESLAHFDIEDRLAPGGFGQYVSRARRAQVLFQAGRLADAVVEMERSFLLNPEFPPSLVLRAGLLQLSGRDAEAADGIRRLRALEPGVDVEVHSQRWFGRTDQTASAPLIDAFRAAWEGTA